MHVSFVQWKMETFDPVIVVITAGYFTNKMLYSGPSALISSVTFVHLYHHWSWSVLDQTVEGGSHLTPMVPAHWFIHLITGRVAGTETYGICNVFPPDDLWIGLDTYTNCILIYDLLLKVWLMGCVTCFICIGWWGKEWPIVTCPFRAPFPGTVCPILNVANIYLIWNI